MKILTRYILKEMIGPTALGFIFYTSLILMQRLFDLAGVIIKRSLSMTTVGKLLLWSLPHIVVLTVPMSLLFGILIAVGRLSSDSEIIAMRSLGVSTRAIYRPVFVFSFAMFLLTLYLTNFVLPKGNRNFVALRAEVFTSSVAKEIKPRVFYDDYENLMIYVDDVDTRTGLWKGVFLADARGDESQDLTTPQGVINASQQASSQDSSPAAGALAAHNSGQRVITAQGGNLSIVKSNRQVWLNLKKAENHVWDPRKPERYDRTRNDTQRILLPDKSVLDTSQVARSLRELDLKQLLSQARDLRHGDPDTYRLAWVEIHKKFSIPFACIVFGILGLPLGITNRRGGKSSGFSLSIAIIVFYYVLIINGEHMAAAGKIPPWLGMWMANIILLALGIYLLTRAGRDSGQRSEGGILTRLAAKMQARKARREQRQQAAVGVITAAAPVEDEPMILNTLDITFPNILDRYILREFVKVLGLVLISTVALFMIISYTDLANDIRRNHVQGSMIISYYRFQIFYVLNYTLPISVLVATLVTFGLLAKNNEVTALKSGGVSLYRVSLPIIAVAAVLSVFAYFLLDFILPFANERSMKLENVIRGRTTAVSLSSQQKTWFLGKGRYLINFLSYDRREKVLSQVQVFELHPTEFRITRRVYAERAQWDGQGWVFSNGWMWSFRDNDDTSTFSPITQPLRLFYAETPEDFATEVKSPDQMTFAQLHRYVGSIRNSGYSAEELTVKLYAKTSWPALSLVMALIALPFAFRIGKRGALYGFGIALVLGIMYWMVFVLFTKFGEVGNLPPVLAAWSANILFSIAAVYMFVHVET